MRTENPTSPATMAARARAQWHRARRALASRGPVLRWSLPFAALAGLAALAYVAAPQTAANVPLHGNQPWSADDANKIAHALDAKGLSYTRDDRGRIEVPGDQLDEARVVLAKLGIGPRSLDEIQKTGAASSPWESPPEIQKRLEIVKENELAEMIRNLDGIISAHVRIHRTKARVGFQRIAAESAFVWLETEGNHEIRPATVQAIQILVAANVPDLKPDTLTITDRYGRAYLIAGNPKIGTLTLKRAREAELTEKILEKLDWIKGVRVTVQMVPAPAPAPVPPPAAAAPATAAPESRVGVNAPLELVSPPGPSPSPSPSPSPAPADAPTPSEEHGLARILVQVPRSFYLNKAMPNHEPTKDDLQSIASRTNELIQKTIDHVLPLGEFKEVDINSFPDGEPVSVPRPGPAALESRRTVPLWVPAAAVGAGVAVILLVAFRLLAARRPEPRSSASAATTPGRYQVDRPGEPGHGPSERVRELIRLDPGSAASVLHRWIGRGGDTP